MRRVWQPGILFFYCWFLISLLARQPQLNLCWRETMCWIANPAHNLSSVVCEWYAATNVPRQSFTGSDLRVCVSIYIPIRRLIIRSGKVSKARDLYCVTWWRHQMEAFSALLAIWAGNDLILDRAGLDNDSSSFRHKAIIFTIHW